MRKIIVTLMAGLLIAQSSQGQGTVYVSNLSQTSTGSEAVGSDSWIAAQFHTGNTANGYLLDSVQLAIANATGSPSGFMVMIYAQSGDPNAILPGSSLGNLSSSLDPSAAGIYTYSPASNFTLLSNTSYFIVLTAGTTIANGAYEWSLSGVNSYNPNGGWTVFGGVSSDVLKSSNGSTWNSLSGVYPQFAITATPIPEPSSSLLLLLGSSVFIYVRRTFHR